MITQPILHRVFITVKALHSSEKLKLLYSCSTKQQDKHHRTRGESLKITNSIPIQYC